MIDGRVTVDREIVIDVEILGGNQSALLLQAVVDTGFNGFLTLPLQILNQLQAPVVGTRRAELGDGNLVELDVHLVRVKWHADEQDVLALQADTTPLLGMSLLWGSHVRFDAQEGGAVTIEAMP